MLREFEIIERFFHQSRYSTDVAVGVVMMQRHRHAVGVSASDLPL